MLWSADYTFLRVYAHHQTEWIFSTEHFLLYFGHLPYPWLIPIQRTHVHSQWKIIECTMQGKPMVTVLQKKFLDQWCCLYTPRKKCWKNRMFFFLSQNTYTPLVKLFVHLYHLRIFFYILNQDFFVRVVRFLCMLCIASNDKTFNFAPVIRGDGWWPNM